MSSTTKSLTPRLVVVLALVAIAVLLLSCGGRASKSTASTTARCFPASSWGPAPDAERPCVEVTRVEEDGSFTYRVSDAAGTERYTAGIGALDR